MARLSRKMERRASSRAFLREWRRLESRALRLEAFREFVSTATPDSAREAVREAVSEAACEAGVARAAAEYGSGAYRMYTSAEWTIDAESDAGCLEWAMMYSLAKVHCLDEAGTRYDPRRPCPLVVRVCSLAERDEGVAAFLRDFVNRRYETSSVYIGVLSMYTPPQYTRDRVEDTRAALTVPFDKMVIETIIRIAARDPSTIDTLRLQPVLVRLIFTSGDVSGLGPLLSNAFGAHVPNSDAARVMFAPDFINGYKHAHALSMRLVMAAGAFRCCGCGMPPCTSRDRFEAYEQMAANPHNRDTRDIMMADYADDQSSLPWRGARQDGAV